MRGFFFVVWEGGWRLVDTHHGIMSVDLFLLWEGCFTSGYVLVAGVLGGWFGICSNFVREGIVLCDF